MFYKRFCELCTQKGVSASRACLDMGLSRSLAAKWKNTGVEKPSTEVLQKMSAYFGMSIDAILGNTPQEKTPTLTMKDERDIARRLEAMLGDMEGPQGALMFDGEPMDDETRELLRASLENQLRMAKIMAKQKFTPKKYRKPKLDE